MLQTTEEEQGALKLAEILADAAHNPEKAASRVEEKAGTKGVLGTIIGFITDYKNKGDLSDEEWAARQLARPEFAETLEGGDARSAAKALAHGIADYECAEKSLRDHIMQGGSRESWIAQQIELGAANNGEDPAGYAEKISGGFKEARDGNAEFLLGVPAPAEESGGAEQEDEIADNIAAIAYVTEAIPPVPDDESDIRAEDEFITGADIGAYPPKLLHERIGSVLKTLTYPVTIALELLKIKVPILKPIPFMLLGAKVRNAIGNIVARIDIAAGRITEAQAVEERMNIETALAGYIIQQKHAQPVALIIAQVFGAVGSTVKHAVQQAVGRVAPAPVRLLVKAGVQSIGQAIAAGVKSFAQNARRGVRAFFGNIRRRLFG